MSTLFVIIFATTFTISVVAGLLFRALFFFVVLVRLADKGIRIEERSRFGALFDRSPRKELQAYFESLDEEERKRWFNRFLRLVPWVTDRGHVMFVIGVHAVALWLLSR